MKEIFDTRMNWDEQQWKEYYNAVGEEILKEEQMAFDAFIDQQADYWIDMYKSCMYSHLY